MNFKVLKMKSLLSCCLFIVSVAFFSCTGMKSTSTTQAKAAISATTADVPGNGTIIFIQNRNEVEMKLELNFPSKAGQTVAVHIHEHGECGNAGNDAHGHWNPTKSNHGQWGVGQFHLGDIGNVKLDASGKGSLTLETNLWSVGTGAANDVSGKAIMVHANADDFTTQPTGNAGGRIGCGVIQMAM